MRTAAGNGILENGQSADMEKQTLTPTVVGIVGAFSVVEVEYEMCEGKRKSCDSSI